MNYLIQKSVMGSNVFCQIRVPTPPLPLVKKLKKVEGCWEGGWNCIYRCDIIHPLVRYHGRSRRSPAPPSGPLGGPSGPLGEPSGPLGGPSGPLGGPSGPVVRPAVRTLEPRAPLFPSSVFMHFHRFLQFFQLFHEGKGGGGPQIWHSIKHPTFNTWRCQFLN